MNKYILNYLSVLFLIYLTGCNLSKYPIDDKPNVKIDSRLLGKWKDNVKDGDQYQLTKKNDYQYNILVTGKKDKKQDKVESYYGFLSSVEDATFLNVHCKDEDSTDRYVFIRVLDIDAAGKKIKLTSVADTTMEFLENAGEVRAYVTANLNKPAFYHDTDTFFKIK